MTPISPVPSPDAVADQTGRVLSEREAEWLDRLARDPASFAAVEREVHDQARHQADLYVAGLLAKASERPEMAQHVAAVVAAAEVPLRPVEKKDAPLVVRLLGGLAITVMTLYCSPRGAHRQGARPRRERALPRVGRLSDQRGEQPQRPGRGGPAGRPAADRAGPRRVGPARPGVGREGGPAHRQRAGDPDAGDSHPRPAALPPRRIARRGGVRGQAGRRRRSMAAGCGCGR